MWSKSMITCASTTAQACETLDELAAKLQSWATNGVKPGTADYVAMLRQMTPEEKQQCKELKSPSLKEQFRREWSERRLAKHKEGRRTGSSWTEIDTSHGVYMNAAQIALDEGFLVDPEGSIQRAKTMMSRCVQMGGSWIDIDRQTDEVLYFRMKREKRESFTKSWETFAEHREVLTAEEIESGAPLPSRSATPKDAESKEKIEDEVKPGEVKPEGKPEATAKAKAKAKAKTKTRPQATGNDNENSDLAGKRSREQKREPRPSPKKAKRSKSPAQLEAEMVLVSYHEAMTKSGGLTHNIKSNPRWAWARTPEIEGKLEELVASLAKSTTAVSLGTVFQDFIAGVDREALAETHGEEKVASLESYMQEEVKSNVAALLAHCKLTTEMHLTHVRLSAGGKMIGLRLLRASLRC